ncbi:MAG: VWA domain-containing protein [Porphyromonas sp.]|nr:VWA domain-containing protein [Porphyromonas sp.]
MTFAKPLYFLLLLAVPLFVYLYYLREKKPATFKISSLGAFRKSQLSWKSRWYWLPDLLLLVAYVLMVVALARPQSSTSHTMQTTEGINIVITLDLSGSMLSRDLQPNRMEAAKTVAAEFVNSRPNDNIGLVVFAGESYTQCPLTTDHAVLLNLINSLEMGLMNDGTAIGSGLATSINRLREIESSGSKVIILLTDGSNNQGAISPLSAAEIAKNYGIKVYTIGVGTMGEAPTPVQTMFGIEYRMMPVEIDEPLMQQISDLTGGQYFRATDNASLRSVYAEIDRMEKDELKVESFTQMTEHFEIYLWIAMILSLVALLLRVTFFKTLP